MTLKNHKGSPSIIERVIFSFGIYVLFFGFYGITNRLIPLSVCTDFSITLDDLIPFIPEFIFPFYLVYAMILLPAILVRDRHLFFRSAVAFTTLIILSCLLFVLIPVHVPRPTHIPDSIAGKLVSAVYRADRPVCGFPSLHVSASFLSVFIVLGVRRFIGLLLLAFASVTSVSTLFVKQHVILDAIGGMVLAVAVHRSIVAGALDGLGRGLRAGFLLLRNTKPRPGGGENPRIVESRSSTDKGVGYDVYEPKFCPRGTFIMVYGLTLKGERDPRLVNFSRCFAESGFRVTVPELSGLKSYRFEEGDLEAIADLASTLHLKYGGAIGITGFSFGAGLALTVAADPAFSGIIDPLLLFGPYHSLNELWGTIVEHYNHTPASEKEWDDYIWIRMVLAYRSLDSLNLHEHERKELIDLLSDYCFEPSLQRKRLFYEQVLKGRDGLDIRRQAPDSGVLEKLSPCGRLKATTSRVLILHDRNDGLIPPEHSEKIYEELRSRDIRGAQRLLVTPLLSHVTRGSAWRIFDVFRILGIMGEIFR